MTFLRRQLPLLITFVTGILFAAQYYIPYPSSELMLTSVSKWLQIIGGFALILGVTSLFHIHAVKIRRREPGWGYSFVLYAGIVGTIIVGLSPNWEQFFHAVIDLITQFVLHTRHVRRCDRASCAMRCASFAAGMPQ